MLIFLCGKMGAGKSTKSSELADERNAVLLSEDEWLSSLYPNQIHTLADYIEYSNRLKPLAKRLVQDMLNKGVIVIMDFPANTLAQRQWFKSIFSEIDADHELIYLDVPSPDEGFNVTTIERCKNESPINESDGGFFDIDVDD